MSSENSQEESLKKKHSFEGKEAVEKVEVARAEFEYWYATQKLDQIASWHPFETLEDWDKKKYPFGRYTIMSMKQNAWHIWQAAFFNALNEVTLVPDDGVKEN